jgi:hypothetical protein
MAGFANAATARAGSGQGVRTRGWLNFKWRGTHHRISLDRELGRHVDSRTAAEREATKIRAAILAGAFRAPAAPTASQPASVGLSLDEFAPLHIQRVAKASGKVTWKENGHRLARHPSGCLHWLAFLIGAQATPTLGHLLPPQHRAKALQWTDVNWRSARCPSVPRKPVPGRRDVLVCCRCLRGSRPCSTWRRRIRRADGILRRRSFGLCATRIRGIPTKVCYTSASSHRRP